ncbi:YxeA family protein [Lysinibacillus fusiformis]|uniref:YxeA family protein n=1 Tax=Lysinibacillus fusiformis TaxID=28031 RepID=UPI003B9F4198
MKKLIIGTLVIIVLGASALAYIGEEYRDRFNPFVSEKTVYALVNEDGSPDEDFPRRYAFVLDTVDSTGVTEEIKLTSSEKSFSENTYLEIYTKGKYVYNFKIIEEKDVPEKAKNKLNR